MPMYRTALMGASYSRTIELSMPGPYRFQIAISYLDEPDGPVVGQIEQHLVSHGKSVFVAKTRQPQLLGTSGVEAFARVFKAEAEQVLVLYRSGWGETPWTRIEKDAINDRRRTDPADAFLKLVIMDGGPAPAWFPSSRIFGRFDRLQIEGIVDACAPDRAVQQATIAPAAAVSKEPEAVRLAAAMDAVAKRTTFLDSAAGVRAADDEAAHLLDQIAQLALRCGAIFERGDDPQEPICSVYREGFSVTVRWSRPFANTLNSASLVIVEWTGRVAIGSTRYASHPKDLARWDWCFDTDENGRYGWRPPNSSGIIVPTAKTADHVLTLLLNRVRGGAATV